MTGQILGGALISANLAGTGWRAIFLINVPVGVLVLGADSHWLPADDRLASRSLDVPGVAALSNAVLLLVLPLTLGQAEGWPGWAGRRAGRGRCRRSNRGETDPDRSGPWAG